MDALLELLDGYAVPPLDTRAKARLAAGAVRAGALRLVPRAPAAELRSRGRRHSRERDRRAVAHHYDVSNDFFGLVLGESLTYSCAIFSRGAQTLEAAQRAKLELVCAKLGLRAGERVLDVGCGWGSFALHAAGEHRADVTAITLSEPQAAFARERAAAAGSPTASRSASRTTATSPASSSTRSPRSAWSSTSAAQTSTPTRSSSPRCCAPAGGC